MTITVGILSLHIHIGACSSLKEKRGRLKPLLTRLRREFNVSVAEIGHLDVWQDAAIACSLVGNDKNHVQRSLQKITDWVERNWPDVDVIDDSIEIISISNSI